MAAVITTTTTADTMLPVHEQIGLHTEMPNVYIEISCISIHFIP